MPWMKAVERAAVAAGASRKQIHTEPGASPPEPGGTWG
jgi:hypothetical protein